MSNPYDKHPGKGFRYIPGYNPPAGTMAEAEKRRIEEAKRQKEQDRLRDQREQERQRQMANQERITRENKRAARAKKTSKANKAKPKTKSKSAFSEVAATLAFLISGGYFYGEMGMEGGESAIAALVVAVIIGYTIKIILTLGVIFLVGSLVFGDAEPSTNSNTRSREKVERPISNPGVTNVAKGRYYVGFKAADAKGFWYNGKQYKHGIKVSTILNNFPAQKAGVRVGDIIYRVDNTELNNMKAFVNYVNLKKNKSIKLFIVRNNRLIEILVKPKYVA